MHLPSKIEQSEILISDRQDGNACDKVFDTCAYFTTLCIGGLLRSWSDEVCVDDISTSVLGACSFAGICQ
jgi:hypothetical protein